MKTKLKSMSKRTLSILLVLLMVVSTVTVGVLTTTAAYVEKDGTVGANWIAIQLNGQNEQWTAPDGEVTINLSSYSSGDKAYFDLISNEGPGTTETIYNQNHGMSTVTGTSYNYSQGNSRNDNRNWFIVGSKTSIEIKLSWSGNAVNVEVTDGDSTASPNYYLRDKTNSRDYTFTATATTGVYTTDVTLGNNETIECYPRSGANDSGDFYGNSGAGTLDEVNDSTRLYKYGTPNTNDSVTLKSNILGAGTYTLQWDVSNTENYQLKLIAFVASSKTVTYGYATGSGSSMGTIEVTKKSGGNDVSIGTSLATVSNGEAVTFKATPVFGYHFVGWYTDAAATTLNTSLTSSANNGSSDIGVSSKTISVNADVTAYAKFEQNTSDGQYYLSGRFATATLAANIHSNTTSKNKVDMYGELTNDTDGIATVTSATNPKGYWTFNEYSTNLPFTLVSGNKYKLETHRTVKQLSEDKIKLQADYGGDIDDYHGAFQFIVHNKLNRFVSSDTAAAASFHSKNEESKAITLTEIPGSASLTDAVEPRFNDYNNLSNGQVVIYLDVTDSDAPKIWYEIVDETSAVADSVTLTASPTRVAKGKNVQLTATLNNANTDAGTIFYDFYRSTDNNFNWTKISADNNTSNVLNYTETSGSGKVYYHVVARSNNTTTSNTNTPSMPFNVRSESTSVDTYTAGVFVTTSNIRTLAADETPTWSADQVDKETSGEIYSLATSTDVTNSAPFVFTVSSETVWDPDYGKIDIDAESNQFCTVAYGTKEVQKEIDGETKTIMIRTYVVTPNPKCSNPTIYIDFKNNKLWAVAQLTGSIEKSQTYNSDSTQGEMVWYYFAEHIKVFNSNDWEDSSISNPGGQDPAGVDGTNQAGMKIYFWNNSMNAGNWRNVVTPANGPTGNNTIYVKTGSFYQNAYWFSEQHPDEYMAFKVYKVQLPIWATSFKFTDGNGGEIDAVPTNKIGSGEESKNHSVTLNPNRIYLLYNDKDQKRVKGVVLDDSMYYKSTDAQGNRSADGNEVKTFNVLSNLINYKDLDTLYNPSIQSDGTYWNQTDQKNYGKPKDSATPYGLNKALSTVYSNKQTPNALYFGVFTYDSGDQPNYNVWNDNQKYYGFGATYNATTLGGSGTQWAQNLAMRKNANSYYASVQNLVGATLTNPNKTGANLNVDKNKNGFGLLKDSRTTVNDQGKSTADLMPLFNYNALSSNGNVAAKVKEGINFPFYESTFKGITTYSYDSTTDRNRVYADASGNKSDRFEIQSTATDNGFARGNDAGGDGMVTGLFPFGGNDDGRANSGFGIEFDMNFYMTNTGYLVDEDSNQQDIAFNFSGDDDVWVYIDGVKVLDLGGAHKVSAGTINFTDMKVYYKSAANDINNVKNVFDDWSSEKSEYVNTVSLTDIMAAYGKPFNNKDASTKHTFQMFYMERGALQSNCVISFNLPQASGLNVKNTVNATNVNPALQEAALYSAASDYFTYSVDAKLVNGSLPTELTSAFTGLKIPATSGNYTQSLNFSIPKYPYNHQTTRVYTPTWAEDYPAAFKLPNLEYILSNSGTEAAGSSLTYDTSGWTRVHDTVYTLSESGKASLEVADPKYIAVTGKTGSNTSGQNDYPGLFHLLSGEKATFDNKVPMNAYVKVTQTQALGGVEKDTSNNNVIKYDPIDNNNVGNYYTTSYSIYDEKSKQYIVEDTPYNVKYGASDSYEAVDARTGSDNGFYFSNYTGNADDVNAAMTVEFTNEIAVGTIRVQKKLEDNSPSNANFTFKVKLGRVFGSDPDSLAEIPGLEYEIYNEDGSPVSTSEQYYSTTTGIVLKAGQYAEIKGIPVETRFEVEEFVAPGYNFSKMEKTSTKTDGTAIVNVESSKEYKETVYAPNAPKTTDISLHTDDDDFKYYVNMIPTVSESHVSGTDNYVSLNKTLFTNARETFDVYFCYYDRETDSTIQGKPASISDKVTQYKTTVNNLDEFIVFKNDANAQKFKDMTGYDSVGLDQFVAYDYAKMIQAQAIEFVEATGTGISNLIDNYRMWTSQKDAVAGIQNITNLHDGQKYSGDNTVYHTDSTGKLQTSGDKWVNYRDNEENDYDPEYNTTIFKAGAKDEFEKIKKIYVWLFNEPKAYTFSVYGAKSDSDLTPVTGDRTFANSVGSTTLTNVAVAKKVTNDNVNSESNNGYYNVKGYYSQRTGNYKGNDYLDDIAYLKAYGVKACIDLSNGSENPNYVRPEEKAEMVIGSRKFAYWSYDAEGKTVASTDYIFGNRVTGDFELYAVYAADPMPRDGQTYGLTIHQDADDVYVDNNGTPMIRLNAMFNPYNLNDNDAKIKDAVLVNVYVTKLLNDGFTKAQIEQLQVTYADQLKSMLYGKHNTTFTQKLNATGQNSVTFELTTKGYVYATAGSSITNKNRLELTTYYKKSVLYPYPKNTDYKVGILQIAAMGYDANGNNTVDDNEWILSDNSILRVFTTGEYQG